ncbi:MAG TPA: RHS repeat-associated core domain-containing protein [Terracidiphilus sp.]|jgi:RHS repeat-associated protein
MLPSACNAVPLPLMNWANYNSANNQITTATAGTYVYDASGNTLNDGNNEYWYDAEGQLCAVQSLAIPGLPITQYVYDAEGARIGKGTLSAAPPNSTPLCAAPLSSGFTLSARYLVDQGGDQVTELSEQGMPTPATENWKHSNVFSAARLTATYDYNGGNGGLHYELADPLGTKRVQANIYGQIEMSWVSLPFGDALTPILPLNPPSTADDATEHHFTQKERDNESNNDYFFARYYNSAIGRFTTPDWSAKVVPVPYAQMSDPQSLNLYIYVRNNPLIRVDADGHCCEAVKNFLYGIDDVSLFPLEQAFNHPIDTVRAMVIHGMDPLSDVEDVLNAASVVDSALHGDARSIGKIFGTGLTAFVGGELAEEITPVAGVGAEAGELESEAGAAANGVKSGGLKTPRSYFGNKTAGEANSALTKKYGGAKSSRPGADTHFDPKSGRSYNVHTDKSHGSPHVDIRKRGPFPDRKIPLKP